MDNNYSNPEIKIIDGDTDYYARSYRSQENIKPSFFFLNPHIQAWKTYYHFENIFIELPDVAPKDEKEIPVVLNDRVMHFMNYFQTRGRKSFSIWLARSGKYIPNMKKILHQRGMPTDLVYLAMIESGFNVKARSHAAAVGPWQFIKPTAKRYGLRVDSWVDERMDPKKSTEAAANYLSDLYAMFHSWELAAAGYNCGEDRVQNAIDKYQINDFWQISEFTLPRETKNYVPKLMAALIIAKDPAKYGFVGITYHEPVSYETLRVAPQKSLRDIAAVIGVSSTKLIELNPALIHDATPPGNPYPIHVPLGYGAIVAQKGQQIASLKNVNPQIAKRSTTHRVRRGDTLGKIAGKYRTSVSKIKRANGLKSSTIRIGQNLIIPGRYTPTYPSSKNTTYTAKYKVKSGDTLGAIAARHRVSASSIRKANGIKGSLIRSGQVLTIPRASGRYYGEDISPQKSTKVAKYKVKSGDTLGGIAEKHGIRLASLKSANNIKGSTIKIGQLLTIPGSSNGSYISSSSSSSNGQPSKYKVRSGDTLGGIAQKHGVKLASIKSANTISGSSIRVGQILVIPNGHYSSSKSSGSGPVSYKVKSGDTLWEIASKHNVTVADIKKWNNLKSNNLALGKKLTIYK
ncbi:MAG: LysM peptidoglycan-binding domain-containing protein [Candidatus Dadabacteria bacterium]|nr:LysM peptidoglycan-binding domain-containing protein [Candidatus Dadabacteria bacterium]